jgi:hypothetical protein
MAPTEGRSHFNCASGANRRPGWGDNEADGKRLDAIERRGRVAARTPRILSRFRSAGFGIGKKNAAAGAFRWEKNSLPNRGDFFAKFSAPMTLTPGDERGDVRARAVMFALAR